MRIEHIAMYVRDLELSRAFYETYFQAKANRLYHNEETGFRSYFLSFGEGARLEIMQRPERTEADRDEKRTGYVHLAVSVGSKKAVDDLTRRLREDGYEVTSGPRTTGDGYYESVVLDGDGNPVEITV